MTIFSVPCLGQTPSNQPLEHVTYFHRTLQWKVHCSLSGCIGFLRHGIYTRKHPDKYLNYFNSTCVSILNNIAQWKLRSQTSVPICWHNETLCSHRQACRPAEYKWEKDKLQVSYEIIRKYLTIFQRATKVAECKYFFSDLITKNSHKPCVLFPHHWLYWILLLNFSLSLLFYFTEVLGSFSQIGSWLLDLGCLILVMLCLIVLYPPPHVCVWATKLAHVRKLWISLSLHHAHKILFLCLSSNSFWMQLAQVCYQ